MHQAAWPTCLWELPKGNVPKAVMWEAGHIKSSQSWLKVSPAWLSCLKTGIRAFTVAPAYQRGYSFLVEFGSGRAPMMLATLSYLQPAHMTIDAVTHSADAKRQGTAAT